MIPWSARTSNYLKFLSCFQIHFQRQFPKTDWYLDKLILVYHSNTKSILSFYCDYDTHEIKQARICLQIALETYPLTKENVFQKLCPCRTKQIVVTTCLRVLPLVLGSNRRQWGRDHSAPKPCLKEWSLGRLQPSNDSWKNYVVKEMFSSLFS